MKPMPKLAPSPIRVLIIGGHRVGRTGLRLLIDSHPRLAVVGEAASVPDTLNSNSEWPDIILLDFDGGVDGVLKILPSLVVSAKGARILILTGVRDPQTHIDAMRSGAMGLVHKEEPAEMLVEAIQRVYAGEVWFDRSMMASLLCQVTRRNDAPTTDSETVKMATLTEREREVVALIGEGLKNRQLAARLFISETTVRHHLTSIFDKLGVSDRLELVIYAYRHGLVKPPR